MENRQGQHSLKIEQSIGQERFDSLPSKFNVLSVCTNFPTRNYPTLGLFVQRRLYAMSKLCNLRVLVPQPWCPGIRPRNKDETLADSPFPIDIRRMFYIPKLANHWNGMWLNRCVEKWLSTLPSELVKHSILDAHFGYPEGVGVFRAAIRRKLPFFITLRGLETDLFRSKKICGPLIDALNHATGVISVSESLKSTAIENGINEGKIRVIGNGVDGSFFSPGNKEQCRYELNFSQSSKLIVSVGSIRRLKGFDLLLEAVKPFRNDPDFQCVIIGKVMENDFRNEIVQRIDQIGMSKSVRLLGTQSPERVVKWLRAADMFVLPTRREGCCNAVLEALSTGVPVITTPAGDNVKFIQEGFNGFIVPHEAPELISNAIVKALGTTWEPMSISKSISSYTWDGASQQLMDYFHEGVSRGFGFNSMA
ncbi:MAG: glycosyltransferase [Planctomycetota bacterium]